MKKICGALFYGNFCIFKVKALKIGTSLKNVNYLKYMHRNLSICSIEKGVGGI